MCFCVQEVQKDDSDTYRCTISNRVGSDEAAAELIVRRMFLVFAEHLLVVLFHSVSCRFC